MKASQGDEARDAVEDPAFATMINYQIFGFMNPAYERNPERRDSCPGFQNEVPNRSPSSVPVSRKKHRLVIERFVIVHTCSTS